MAQVGIQSVVFDPDVSRIAYYDHGYGRPSVRPRVLVPTTYHLGTSREQHPAVALWHAHLRDLVTPIRETSGSLNGTVSNELNVVLQYVPIVLTTVNNF